jgi:hypothetical protein
MVAMRLRLLIILGLIAIVPASAVAAPSDLVLRPGSTKKVGRFSVVCTTAAIAKTSTRIVLRPGFEVKIAGVRILCKRGTPKPTPTPTPTPTPSPPAALGTRANPYPLGAEVSVRDWKVRVNSVKFNAWDDVRAANSFNDAPAPGWEDVIVNVTMTYTGAKTGTPWLDFDMKYVGATNVGYPTSGFDHYCGVPPAPNLSDFNDVFPGGSVTGNRCLQIAQADEGSLVGYWSDFLSSSPGPYFRLR